MSIGLDLWALLLFGKQCGFSILDPQGKPFYRGVSNQDVWHSKSLGYFVGPSTWWEVKIKSTRQRGGFLLCAAWNPFRQACRAICIFTVLGMFFSFLVFWFCSFLLGVCKKRKFVATIPRVEMVYHSSEFHWTVYLGLDYVSGKPTVW